MNAADQAKRADPNLKPARLATFFQPTAQAVGKQIKAIVSPRTRAAYFLPIPSGHTRHGVTRWNAVAGAEAQLN